MSEITRQTQAARIAATLASHPAVTIAEKVRQAGIVGAGGAGFPTYVKLQAKAEIYLVNAAECEPMLKVDQQLMATQADRLIRGLSYGMAATGASQGIIALKAKYQAAIAALEPLLPPQIRIHILPDVYPAGDEVITIWQATGRRVPAGELPISLGVVVNNVQTLLNLTSALEDDHPVTHRTLTINGAVVHPMTITVPLGVTLGEVLTLAGGATVPQAGYINGGPMMGHLVTSLAQPVTKTTGGLLVLPAAHLLIQRRERSDADIINLARTVCEQCGLCTDLCPRHIIGHELPPHLLVRAVNYQQLDPPSVLLSALTCSECSVCESYACPVDISPMRLNRLLKTQLRAQGLRYQGEIRAEDPMAAYRLVPIPRLISRLQLEPFYQAAPLQPLDWQPEQVTLPLQQHIGAPAQAVVAVGDSVRLGQCIAVPKEGALSVAIHASIDGVISAVAPTHISIRRA
ncbi:4Fe-4S dicluster domain-containing protein [Pseudaeromonas sp. ZJS20]|uniref:4Fe-4S dicluster domain-containing protein n=1 Tax=Pseudaeromonas aegiceratis TaxID=3153928 RepID=UPI00390CCA9A